MKRQGFSCGWMGGLALVFAFALVQPSHAKDTATPPVAKGDKAERVHLIEPNAVQSKVARVTAQILSNSRFHYRPKKLDRKLSSQIMDDYLDSLDGEKLFFDGTDAKRFETHRFEFDSVLQKGSLKLPFDIFKTYIKRVDERMAFAQKLLDQPFDFNGNDTYDYDREDAEWPADRAQAEKLWTQRVKNDWLRLKLAGKKEAEIRKTLKKRYKGWSERLKDLDSEDVFQLFMNAYASVVEPHTAYMNPRTTENFNIAMKLSLEGIGAVLQRRDDFVLIRSVVKGGPADKEGTLDVGDRIVAVGQGDKGPMVDIVGWRIDDAVELIRGKKGTTVRLDVLPAALGADGESQRIRIVRDKVKLEEQAAQSRVIEWQEPSKTGDKGTTRRVGVVELPTFYIDFEARRKNKPDYRSATRDVARLIKELKDKNVEGIVMDLRSNGGGSLVEAVELTGLFIDEGPVVQIRNQTGRVHVERDTQEGVAWDGPLAVLINRSSASASEIFAAAIQDYGRGIIIGEPSFGKGTVQNLVDLDMFTPGSGEVLGQLKMTVAQFYRINGQSTQHRGVLPDVAFPLSVDLDEYGESSYDYALPYNEIAATKYGSLGDFSSVKEFLKQAHTARVKTDKEFIWWKEDIDEFKKQADKTSVSLNEGKRVAERERKEARRIKREAERKALGLDKDDSGKIELDDGLQANERDFKKDVEDDDDRGPPDVLMREAAHILVDAIDLLSADKGLAKKVWAKPCMVPVSSIGQSCWLTVNYKQKAIPMP